MERLPAWLRNHREPSSLRDVKLRLRKGGLSTVCEEARCPNISECFSKKDATFLILGDICTRNCRFCSVSSGRPEAPDPDEPALLSEAALELGLKHVVITSVTRDDLADKGAGHFAACISEVNKKMPGISVEVLTPDFSGDTSLLDIVLEAKPDVFGHNVETVSTLFSEIKPGADLDTSLAVLDAAGRHGGVLVKTGFMVGLGESSAEIEDLIRSVKEAGVDILTIGQYLRPTRNQVPVSKYWEPEAFETWAMLAKGIGISYVVAGPFVRSSYRAGDILKEIRVQNQRRKDAVCKD
ncbi:MAG TPA: lipoyl synthase [Desulfomonilia bacterium]